MCRRCRSNTRRQPYSRTIITQDSKRLYSLFIPFSCYRWRCCCLSRIYYLGLRIFFSYSEASSFLSPSRMSSSGHSFDNRCNPLLPKRKRSRRGECYTLSNKATSSSSKFEKFHVRRDNPKDIFLRRDWLKNKLHPFCEEKWHGSKGVASEASSQT